MDFDKIHELASRIPDKRDRIISEDAAKMAFVLPFISALGYDFQDPMEVVPEYAIDEGGRKNEYIDYVILKDEKPIMLIECKWKVSTAPNWMIRNIIVN
jgi:predicted type IV restriction endonuclease